MLEIICNAKEFEKVLRGAPQWELLLRYLERNNISVSVWQADHEEEPVFTQIPSGKTFLKDLKDAADLS